MRQFKLQIARRSSLAPIIILGIRLIIVLLGLAVIAHFYPAYQQAATRVRMPDFMMIWSGMVAVGVTTGLLFELVPPRRLSVAWVPLLMAVLALGVVLYVNSPHSIIYIRSMPLWLHIILDSVRSMWAAPILSVLLGVLVGHYLKGKP